MQPGQRQDLEEKPQSLVGEQQTSLELSKSVESGETGDLGESGESTQTSWQRANLSEIEFVTFVSSDF